MERPNITFVEVSDEYVQHNSRIKKHHNLPSGISYFHIKIDKKLENEDFVIVAEPLTIGSDPDIYLSS